MTTSSPRVSLRSPAGCSLLRVGFRQVLWSVARMFPASVMNLLRPNDPFVISDGVDDLTPWWLAPNDLCQNTLEVADVVEGLPDALFPVTLNGTTYHPQNVALMQWLEFKPSSDALDGAYSYPDTSILTSPPTLQNPNCHP